MNDSTRASDRDRVVTELRELIEALDRRVARVERVGEVRIAREAAALRKEAARRIQEITATEPERDVQETERSDAVMTDDGGPLPEQ